MKQNFKPVGNQKGFTLVEIAIVVAISLLLLAGVIGVNRIIANTKANDEIGELKQESTGIQKIYANNSNYATATLTDIIALKGLPDARITSTTTATNRWGGAITIAPATLATANDAIKFSTAGVPEYECVSVIPQVEPGFSRISVGGTDVKAYGGTLNKTTLGTQCTGGNVAVDYYFTK